MKTRLNTLNLVFFGKMSDLHYQTHKTPEKPKKKSSGAYFVIPLEIINQMTASARHGHAGVIICKWRNVRFSAKKTRSNLQDIVCVSSFPKISGHSGVICLVRGRVLLLSVFFTDLHLLISTYQATNSRKITLVHVADY